MNDIRNLAKATLAAGVMLLVGTQLDTILDYWWITAPVIGALYMFTVWLGRPQRGN